MNKIEKIVCIGDIHYRNIQRHIEYRAVSENFLSKLEKISADRVIILGDLVHSRNQISPELVSEVSWFLDNISKRCGALIIIPGNHDIVEQNKERMDALTPIIKALNKPNIIYYTKSGLYEDDNVVWVVYSIYDNNMTPPELAMKPYKGKYVGLYHGTIVGAVNDAGFTFAHGAEVSKFDNCDVTLCADIHCRQVFTSKTGNPIIMGGSLIQQDFGENISGHGFCLVTLDDKIKYEFVDLDNPVKYLTFKINDITDIEENKEVLINS